MINLFQIFAGLGLILIIIGTFMISNIHKFKRKNIYFFLLAGGILLLTYSFYIKDFIFITLQSAYILITIYDLIKLKNKKD